MADNKIPEWLLEAARQKYTSELREWHNLRLSFIAGVMSPEADKFHDQMRWVKASDELPERKGEYFIIRDDYKSVAMFDGEKFYGNDNWIDVKLWLYEPEKPQP